MSEAKTQTGRREADFIVVANRLPVDLERMPDGTERWKHSPGGLVSALDPFLRSHHGAWVGWPGDPRCRRARVRGRRPARCTPSCSRADEVRDYYEGFSNATLWPLYHDVVAPPVFERDWWRQLRPGQQPVRRRRRQGRRPRRDRLDPGLPAPARPGHAPRTAPRPAHRLLPAHPVPADRAVHAAAVAHRDRARPARRRPRRLPPARRRAELPVASPQARRPGTQPRQRSASAPAPVSCRSATARCGSARSRSPSTRPASTPSPARRRRSHRAEQIRATWATRAEVLLGVDRLDYTKGIDLRLRALQELLTEGRIDPSEVAMVQLATPSRERVEHYQRMRERHRAGGRAGSTASSPGSAARSCTTCTSRWTAASWRRSTWPRTSWW